MGKRYYRLMADGTSTGSLLNDPNDSAYTYLEEPVAPLTEAIAKWNGTEWVENIERTSEIADQEVKKNLNDIDLKSIRSIREWMVLQKDCPEFLKQYEEQAKKERTKIK